MKGGKDDKFMEPLFPRLHVNDSERGGGGGGGGGGGPRAPPRNKMALYEQLTSTPTHQRSIPSNNATTLASSSQGGEHERPLFSPFYIPTSTAAHLVDKLHSRSSKRTNLSVTNCSKVVLGNGIRKTPTTTNSSSMQLRRAHDKHLKRTNTTDLTSRHHGRNHGQEYLKESVIDREMQKLVSNSSAKENTSAEPLERTHASLNQEHQIQVKKEFFLRVNRKSCSRGSLENGHVNPSEAGDGFGNNYCQDKAQSSLQVIDVDINDDDVSEVSMVDSMSGLDISHDDLVGAIGQKDFRIARKAIVDQQRLFGEQVFELHRVIKVQKLIAGSPHLLFQDESYLREATLKQVSPVKKLPSGYAVKSLAQIKAENDTQHPNHRFKSTENTIGNCPVPPPNKDVDTGGLAQCSSYMLQSGNQLPPPVSTENKTSPWCFQPPPAGNQWLVPIMSPSEGLVYKPCSGAFPSTAGFMAPIYGGWGPMILPPVAAYGFPASNQQGVAVLSGGSPVSQADILNNGMPIVNPINWGSNFLPQCQVEQLSGENVNYNRNSGSQHNMFNKKTDVVSCAQKAQTARGGELRENAASSHPLEKEEAADGRFSERRDASVLSHEAPPSIKVSDCPSQSENSAPPVIKVIPHNPRTATESAVRIFQSIQAERRQYDRSSVARSTDDFLFKKKT